MEISEDLIQRYFLQECTPEERAAVSAYFDEYPEKLDLYLSDKDWEDFEPDAALHPVLSDQMLSHIEQNIQYDATETRSKWFDIKKLAIAASVLVAAGLGTWFYTRAHYGAGKPLLAAVNNTRAGRYNDTIKNISGQARLIDLQDGSQVTLSAQSEIAFSKPFVQQKRDIWLKGEAVFKVAKDKTRPFTVYAGGLSTTALGTRFKVSAFADAAKTSVMLYTGKVVVKHYQKPAAGGDVYLNPGQQLVMNTANQAVRVSSFGSQNVTVDAEKGRTLISNNNIRFQNEALQEVIRVLQDTYHITIQANQEVIAKRYYTGTVNTGTDVPGDVLKTIAKLNNLVLTRQNNVYKLAP